MKLVTNTLLLLVLAGCATTEVADETSTVATPSARLVQDGQDAGADQDALMAKMIALGAPGPEHEALAREEGTWNVNAQMYMEPGADPVPMEGTADIRMILGGRERLEHFHSTWMDQPFEGMGITGYDNIGGQYWNVWLDNWSTWQYPSTGVRTDAGDLEFHGIARDAMTPDGREMRTVIHTDGPDKFTMRMFETLPGTDERLAMVMVYTRQQ